MQSMEGKVKNFNTYELLGITGARQEQLALGETPNLAARLQGLAGPNTLVISAATLPLLGGFFTCQPLGTPLLKGLAQPVAVYRVLYESMARSRLEAVGSTGWTPLVGREQEIGLLRECWAQVKDGTGRHGAPGVADTVPMLPVPSAYRVISVDRAAGARGAAL
jgi:hypothetical protein